MTLTNAYVQNYGQLPDFFRRISEGQAPEQFTTQYLKDLGFTSTSYRAIIPLLKALGFLSTDGTPSTRYHEYRNQSQSRHVMADALHEAYMDLFIIKAIPTDTDRALIQGKFKSAHNVSDRLAQLMTNTFFALLSLADLQAKSVNPVVEVKKPEDEKKPAPELPSIVQAPSLHYNIQIHLPATKDIEVFNAIFKSLREHLLN
jgi:hypothetical protein